MKTTSSLLLTTLSLALLSGCVGSGPNTQRGALGGAALGGIAGAIVGHNNKGGGLQGAAIGAGLGAIIGGTMGNSVDHENGTVYGQQPRAQRQAPPPTVVYEQPPPPPQQIVIVEEPPPPPPPRQEVVVIERRPGPEYVWVPGYYAYRPQERGYIWISGGWARPPRERAVWESAHWERRGGTNVFIEGTWR